MKGTKKARRMTTVAIATFVLRLMYPLVAQRVLKQFHSFVLATHAHACRLRGCLTFKCGVRFQSTSEPESCCADSNVASADSPVPIEASSVNAVRRSPLTLVSPKEGGNGVLNLGSGGTFAIADVTLQNEISGEARNYMDSWSTCIAGALTDSDYRESSLRRGLWMWRLTTFQT